MACNKNKLHKKLDYRSRDTLNFDILEKGLGIVSPSYFVYNYSRKMVLMLYSINWRNFIVRLILLLATLGNILSFFYKQLVYKQLALGWQIAKQLLRLNPLLLNNPLLVKTIDKRKVEFFLCKKREIAVKPTMYQN